MSTKTALVTGGVRGIGLAIAEMFLTRAMNVVVVTHDAKGAPSTLAKEVKIVELDPKDHFMVQWELQQWGHRQGRSPCLKGADIVAKVEN